MNNEYIGTLITGIIGIAGTFLGFLFSTINEKRRYEREIKFRSLEKTEKVYMDILHLINECPVLHLDADGKHEYAPTSQDNIRDYLGKINNYKYLSGFELYASQHIQQALLAFVNELACFFMPNFNCDKSNIRKINAARNNIISMIRTELKIE